MTSHEKSPEFFLSMPHPCGYLPGRTATSLFLDPRCVVDSARYTGYVAMGFRRSGDLIYRPHCRECNACTPVRVPVARFQPNRSQRRIWQRNQDLEMRARPAVFDPEHFALYLRYQETRHPGGGMDDTDPKKYANFLLSRHIDTRFYEMRCGGALLGVVVLDALNDGLSAVYTFFEPAAKARALGVYAVLWEIEHARALELSHVYLGYLIRECPKMAYKENYRPLEALLDGRWAVLSG